MGSDVDISKPYTWDRDQRIQQLEAKLAAERKRSEDLAAACAIWKSNMDAVTEQRDQLRAMLDYLDEHDEGTYAGIDGQSWKYVSVKLPVPTDEHGLPHHMGLVEALKLAMEEK